MNSLVGYTSDEDVSNKSPAKSGSDKLIESHAPTLSFENHVTPASAASLESEWENFEKMIAGGEDMGSSISTNDTTAPIPTDSHTVTSSVLKSASCSPEANGNVVSTSPQHQAPAVTNPYAYLAYLTGDSSSTTDEDQKAAHNHLEEFLEKAAQAAADAAEKGSHSEASAHSGSEECSGSESGSESASDKEKSASPIRSQIHEEDKSNKPSKTVESIDTTSSDRKSSDKSRRSSSIHRSSRSKRSRSRSRRSSSRSKRSRSRSRHRHRRHRSTSRSRHGGSSRRHKRRSSSRHRHSRPRSRSPRRRVGSSRYRSSRHKREHRRSGRSRSRDRRSGGRLRIDPRSRAPPPEDFKTRMKRELQEAAKNALAGKTPGVTPQQALMQTMAAMHAKAQELTGVSVPKYYNPTAVNPLKYAEQQQKRKLLWSKAAENKAQSQSNWQGTEVATDEKYRKLMGIKGDLPTGEVDEDQRRKQMELFQKLDQEYAMARLTTHTHRGMGLGVVSSVHVTGQVPANPTESEQHPHPAV